MKKKNKKVLITGGQGFIGSYLCQELLNHEYNVISVDNFSKYGSVIRPQDTHPNFKLYNCDVLSNEFKEIFMKEKCDYLVLLACRVGGIEYFHKIPFTLLADNELINSISFDLAVKAHQAGWLERVIVASSSMVYESAFEFPSKEESVATIPPPISSYGFSKLACEYFAKAAFDQYGLKYSIVRPFNCAGIGEDKVLLDKEIKGNKDMMLSHVLPDYVSRILENSGNEELRILGDGSQCRALTNGVDIGRGIRLIIESEEAINEDFNISSSEVITMFDLAKIVWKEIHGDKELKIISDKPFKHDVNKRIPSVEKAKNILGFEAKIPLIQSVREVISYFKEKNLKENEI